MTQDEKKDLSSDSLMLSELRRLHEAAEECGTARRIADLNNAARDALPHLLEIAAERDRMRKALQAIHDDYGDDATTRWTRAKIAARAALSYPQAAEETKT